MAASRFDRGRLIDAPDATSKDLRETWIGLVAYLNNTSFTNAEKSKAIKRAFGPGPYKFLNGNVSLVPTWIEARAPAVPLASPDYDREKIGPNSANFRVDYVEPFGKRKGGRWRFMRADDSDPQVQQILKSPLAEEGSVVLFTSLEKKRDSNNRSAYRNVKKPVPGEILELYDVSEEDPSAIFARVVVERISQRYLLVTF